jgi:hypothetical protein
MSTITATTATASVHRSGWGRARRIGLGAVRVILAATDEKPQLDQ